MIYEFRNPKKEPQSGSLLKPQQIRKVLSEYSYGVMNKGWKDYGINTYPQKTEICVLEKGQDGQDGQILLSFTAERSRSKSGGIFYRVHLRGKQICSSRDFQEALWEMRRADMPKRLQPTPK